MSNRPIVICALVAAACTGEDASSPAKPKEEPPACVMTEEQKTLLVRLERAEENLASCRADQRRMSDAEAADEARQAEPAEAPELEIKAGGTYLLGQGNQTVVMNPKPVDDGQRRFAKGSVCRFDPNGTVKVIGRYAAKTGDDEETEYLVRYAREPAPEALRDGALENSDSEPYECPTGTVFFLDDPSILEEHETDPRFEEARKLLNSEKP